MHHTTPYETRVRRQGVIASVLLMMLFLAPARVLAGNRLSLRPASTKDILIELSNSDLVAGLQFSINARGGVVLREIAASGRIGNAGWQVFQFLQNDSTLNVVLLAPYRSSLSSGSGAIGTVSVTIPSAVAGDTARMFFTNVVICDAQANTLEVGADELIWSVRAGLGASSASFVLDQNYPNPFNPSTTIAYELRSPAHVRLEVYDLVGRRVRALVNESQREGRYAVKWYGDDEGGSKLASGMYVARLQVAGQVAIRKMILAK